MFITLTCDYIRRVEIAHQPNRATHPLACDTGTENLPLLQKTVFAFIPPTHMQTVEPIVQAFHLDTQDCPGTPVFIVHNLADGKLVNAADFSANTQDRHTFVILVIAQFDGQPCPVTVQTCLPQPIGNVGCMVIHADFHTSGHRILSFQHSFRNQFGICSLVDFLHGNNVRFLFQNSFHKPVQLVSIVFFLKRMCVQSQNFHNTHPLCKNRDLRWSKPRR